MKKLALAVAAVFAVCSLSAALPQLEKVWKIDFRQKITEAEMIAISKDGKLPGTKTFQLDENGSYTANFNSALSAVLVNTVTAPADGNYLLGFCADWKATIFVNGEKVADMNMMIKAADVPEKELLLQTGKKNFKKVIFA